MATLASATFREPALNSQFQIHRSQCGFENVLKKMPCLGNLCNDSCLNIYKGVCLFEKMIQCFEICFEIVLKLCCEVCLKNGKDVLQDFLIK